MLSRIKSKYPLEKQSSAQLGIYGLMQGVAFCYIILSNIL